MDLIHLVRWAPRPGQLWPKSLINGQARNNQGQKAHFPKSRLAQSTYLCSRVTGNLKSTRT